MFSVRYALLCHQPVVFNSRDQLFPLNLLEVDFFSQNKIVLEAEKLPTKNYQKYLLPTDNQRYIWF